LPTRRANAKSKENFKEWRKSPLSLLFFRNISEWMARQAGSKSVLSRGAIGSTSVSRRLPG
jgi:hypothetical protein